MREWDVLRQEILLPAGDVFPHDSEEAETEASVATVAAVVSGGRTVWSDAARAMRAVAWKLRRDEASRRLLFEMGALVLLPHHNSEEYEVDTLVVGLEHYLRARLRADPSNPPALVTIAESSGDNYTPPGQLQGAFHPKPTCTRPLTHSPPHHLTTSPL